MREQISLMLQKNTLRDISRHSRVLLERIPGTQGFWRVESSNRLKTTERPHRRFSLSHAHQKFSAEYHRKRRLSVQNRSAECVISCTDTSRQQEVPSFYRRKQGISVLLSTSLQSEHCPSGIYSFGAHSGSLPPSSGDISNPISRRLVNTPPRLSSFILPPVSVSKHTEHGRPQVKRSEIRTRTSSDYPVSGASVMPGSEESFPPNIQGSGDNSTCVPDILPVSAVVQRSVPVHGITQLGLRSHPTGTTTHEAPTTTLLFTRSDKPVCSPMSIRPFSPCYPTQAVAGPIVSHIRNPDQTFPGGFHDFHGRLNPGLGRSHGGFPDFRCFNLFRTHAPHQCAGAQDGNIGSPTLGLSITGPSGYDHYRQYHCCSLYQQTGWSPLPHPVAAGSGSASMATVSRYSHPGQTHSRLPQCDSRPVISADQPITTEWSPHRK